MGVRFPLGLPLRRTCPKGQDIGPNPHSKNCVGFLLTYSHKNHKLIQFMLDVIDYAKKFKGMREVGALTRECLDRIEKSIAPDISTEWINSFVREFGEQNNIQNAQYKYTVGDREFPAYACTSLNEEMCHGLPSEKNILKEGDIIKVDVTFKKNGYHGDACRTFFVGDVSNKIRKFVEAAKHALYVGIVTAGPNVSLGEIGRNIEKATKKAGYSVSKDFVGHGIGLGFHEWPQVPHFNDKHSNVWHQILKPGDTFTIEPIVCMKSSRYKTLKDGWTVVTRDKSLAAQFEATIGITYEGNEVFCS